MSLYPCPRCRRSPAFQAFSRQWSYSRYQGIIYTDSTSVHAGFSKVAVQQHVPQAYPGKVQAAGQLHESNSLRVVPHLVIPAPQVCSCTTLKNTLVGRANVRMTWTKDHREAKEMSGTVYKLLWRLLCKCWTQVHVAMIAFILVFKIFFAYLLLSD